MAIEFVVEDGTGKSDATSYLSVADFRQYWENRGVDYSAKTDDEIEVCLNVATTVIDGMFPYRGEIYTNSQRLQFPRAYLYDRNNIYYNSQVPPQVESATAEAARYELDGGDLYEIEDSIKSRSMGPVSVTYSGQKKVGIAKRIERHLSDFVAQMRVRR